MASLSIGVLAKDSAPNLELLRERVAGTPTAQELQQLEAQWAVGEGPAHTDCMLRLFGHSEDEVREGIFKPL
jgi:hypothetical protein